MRPGCISWHLTQVWEWHPHYWSLEKAMATHSSTHAWKIPGTEEPGGLQSMGSLRVGHDWVTSLSLFTFMHWRRTWQPTPVFLPGESQGWGSLVGCHLCGRTESDTTEATAAAAGERNKGSSHLKRIIITETWSIYASLVLSWVTPIKIPRC